MSDDTPHGIREGVAVQSAATVGAPFHDKDRTKMNTVPQATDAPRGIMWMLLTVSLFVGMDTIGKFLAQSYPVIQVTWARFAFHALWLVTFLGWRLPVVVRTRRLKLQLARGALMVIANTLFIAGVSVMPLVDTNAILLTSPLFVTALSVPLLGEQVGIRRWSSVLAGMVGALIIIRPGYGTMQWVALFPLGAAISFALYQLATREVTRFDPPLTTLFYTVSVGTPVTSLIMPFVWVTPDVAAWLLMGAMGLIGAVSHFTLIKAFTAAPAAVIAPFNYTNLVWATLFGFAVFGELPDVLTVLGASIITASGLYAFFREHRVRGASP